MKQQYIAFASGNRTRAWFTHYYFCSGFITKSRIKRTLRINMQYANKVPECTSSSLIIKIHSDSNTSMSVYNYIGVMLTTFYDQYH